MANKTNGTTRLHHVTMTEPLFYGNETWPMAPKNVSGKNETFKGVLKINSTGQPK
jgi:hypothetical protein